MRAADDEVGSCSSGAEEIDIESSPGVVEETPPPLPPKARVPRKVGHKAPRRILSDEEDEDQDPTPLPPSPPPAPEKKGKATKKSRRDGEQNGGDEKKDDKSAKAGPSGGPKTKGKQGKRLTPHALMMEKELEFQRAMDLAVEIMTPLKVNIEGLTMCPDQGTLECFTKAVQAWLNENRLTPPLLYTTLKTFRTVTARMLMDFVIKDAGLPTGSWNPSGCFIWRHKSNEDTGLHCFHGTPMIAKEQIIEMDLTSENAQRALREDPTRAKVTANKWGRQVVRVSNNDAACCYADVSCVSGNFSSRSCGMFYTEAAKALEAFKQIGAYQAASYPNMKDADALILAPLKCDCNWNALDGVPLHGRQLAKLTPFAITGVGNIDRDQVEDPKVLASIEHPAVIVFQCCNPAYRGARSGANGKNCDFKISTPDVMTALQIAKKIWFSCTGKPAPTKFPEFKWGTQYQVQNVVLPTGVDDEEDSPF